MSNLAEISPVVLEGRLLKVVNKFFTISVLSPIGVGHGLIIFLKKLEFSQSKDALCIKFG